MTVKPYTAEELEQLRVFASGAETYNANMTARLMAHLAAGLLANLDAAEKERDELRLRLAQAEEALDVERAGAMHAQLEADALREAGRALVADLEGATGDFPDWCNSPRGCCRLASFVGECDRGVCDEHKSDLRGDLEELSYAPALRRLRALVEVRP